MHFLRNIIIRAFLELYLWICQKLWLFTSWSANSEVWGMWSSQNKFKITNEIKNIKLKMCLLLNKFHIIWERAMHFLCMASVHFRSYLIWKNWPSHTKCSRSVGEFKKNLENFTDIRFIVDAWYARSEQDNGIVLYLRVYIYTNEQNVMGLT